MNSRLDLYKSTNFTENCPTDNSYFTTPEFLSRTVHIIAIVSIPLNLFGFYCILFKTPAVMREMKWCLLHLQFWTLLMDLNYLLLLIPFFFLPLAACGFTGLLSDLGVPTIVQHYMYVLTDGGITVSTLMILDNRHRALVPFDNKFRINQPVFRILLVLLNFLLGCTIIIPTIIFDNNTEDVKLDMLEFIPCPNVLFFDERTFALQYNDLPNYLIPIGSLITTLEELFLLTHCIYYVYSRNSTITGGLSPQARKTQKTLFIASVIQSLVPLLSIIIPTFYTSYRIVDAQYDQAYSNFLTITFSLHGIIATLALIVVNKPYRDFVMRIIGVRKEIVTLISPNTSKNQVFTKQNK